MKEVKLFVYDHRSDRRDYVQTVVIPAFLTPPDVIVWGTRYFKHLTDNMYIECFAVHAVNTLEQYTANGGQQTNLDI